MSDGGGFDGGFYGRGSGGPRWFLFLAALCGVATVILTVTQGWQGLLFGLGLAVFFLVVAFIKSKLPADRR